MGSLADRLLGGTFIVALLVWAIHTRRQRLTYPQLPHMRPREPSTPILTPTPMRIKFFSHPIFHDRRYSTRSSRELSRDLTTKNSKLSAKVPPEVAARFYAQNPYIESTWNTTLHTAQAPTPPPKTPEQDSINRHTFLIDASPDAKAIKRPEKAQVTIRPTSSSSRLTRHSSSRNIKSKSPCRLSMVEVAADEVDNFITPPGSPMSQQLLHDARDRWSWTNSQAPTTPRLNGRHSLISSRSSVPQFRNVVSWIRGQKDRLRIDEEEPQISATILPTHAATKPALKNQASKPTLAPRKLSKSNVPRASLDKALSLGSMFRTTSRSNATAVAAAGGQIGIQMHDR
jgi:hypothetical protein